MLLFSIESEKNQTIQCVFYIGFMCLFVKAKGLSSSHVVAINIADGVLTLFTKTA
jgi:hypothetical protein